MNQNSRQAYDLSSPFLSLPAPERTVMPLPGFTDRKDAQEIIYFKITLSGQINLPVLGRTCQVNVSSWFLLDKSKNSGLKLNNGTGK